MFAKSLEVRELNESFFLPFVSLLLRFQCKKKTKNTPVVIDIQIQMK